jgi:hypothetical protein
MPKHWIAKTCLVACLLYVTSHTAPAFAQSSPDSDWSRIVPGDAHFYAELHGLAQVRDLFRKLNIWDLVRDLGERDRPGATTRPWPNRTQKFLGMDTDDAINRLLSRHAALIATDAAQWQNGVVLGELADDTQLKQLLSQWDAKLPYEEETVKCYTLRGGLRLAVHNRVIALGPSGDPEGLWGRTLLLMAGKRGPQLGARAEFAALRSRMSRDYQGLVYTSWDEGDPNSIAECHRLMAGFDVGPDGITAELHGQRYRPLPDEAYAGFPLNKLPITTLSAYAGRTDFAKLLGAKVDDGGIDPRSIFELFLGFFAHGEDSPVNLLTQLGPNFAVFLSREESSGVQLPVMAAVCDSSKPAEHLKQLDQVMGFFAVLIGSLNQPPATTAPAITVETSLYEGVELHHVRIGPSLARRMGIEILAPIECCWTVLDGQLMLSSSRRFAEELIRTSRGKSPGLEIAAIGAPSTRTETGRPAEVLILRGSDLSAMIRSWLEYIRVRHPDVSEPAWWQTWALAQFEKNTELGLTVQADPHGRAIVREVQVYSPARNLLMYEDIIVGVGSEPLDTAHPARDLVNRYHDRGSAREFVLDILRKDQKMTVKIPVTPADALDISKFDPMLDLQRLQTLLARVRLLTLTRLATRPDRLDADLKIEWHSN